MTIVITGATGQLGRLAIDGLLARGIPASEIVATGRSADKLAALEALGVTTAQVDFADPASFSGAFDGAETLLLVSTSEPGKRVALHSNAIDAAKAAGVKRIIYTSAPHADTTTLILAPEHKATEQLIRESGISYTFLRNSWYTENYVGAFAQARETGTVVGSAGSGRVASASRKDYADAAAAVIAGDGHDNATYELSGDVAWTFDELAVAFADALGRDVVYTPLTAEQHTAALQGAGLDEGTIGFVVGLDHNIEEGTLAETSGDLARLIGRPTTPMPETVRSFA
ncbi:MAG: NAD(P)-dependent oxidoreductase [Microbacteriaceae bacterium]|nr:NAD(P)-dependent oxidoreductase [Microbacteriaceae bacterium]